MTDGNNGVDSTATVTGGSGGAAAAGAQPRSARGARRRPATLVAWAGYSESAGVGEPVYVPAGAVGTWYYVDCTNGDRTIVFVPTGSAIDPRQLAQQARRHLSLGAPDTHLAPSADRWQYVNEKTWLWLAPDSWVPRRSVASVPGLSVIVDAAPERVDWKIETGTLDDHGHPTVDTVTCNGPGTPFRADVAEADQSSDCAYLWKHSSASAADRGLAITATAFYRVTWSVAGAPGGGSFGLLPSAPRTVRVTVAEIQTVARAQG